MEWQCANFVFHNVEVLDGMFSCVAEIRGEQERWFLNLYYDVEENNLSLENCNDILYNSYFETYSVEDIGDLLSEYGFELRAAIRQYIRENGDVVFCDTPLL